MEKENHPFFWQANAIRDHTPSDEAYKKTDGFLAPKDLDQVQCKKRCVQYNSSEIFYRT
jgi:hypothetical protein